MSYARVGISLKCDFTEITYRKKATKIINIKTIFNKTKSSYQTQMELLEGFRIPFKTNGKRQIQADSLFKQKKDRTVQTYSYG